MTPRGHPNRARHTLVAVGLVTTVLTATACATTTLGASMTRPTVDTNFTRDAAQTRMFEHFTETLRRVPTTLSLGRAAPKPVLQAEFGGITVPCNDDSTVHNGPVNLQVGFWVQGVAAGSETQAYRAVVQAFRDAGWSTVPDKGYPDEVTRAYTPDGYAIVAQLNPEGGLSLTGSSPCFPAANNTTTTPQPTTIAHPAG